MRVRKAEIEDAAQLAMVMEEVEQSGMMLFEPGERTVNPEQMEKRISSLQEDPTSTILIAEEEGEVVGYLFAMGNETRRTKHCAYLVVGVAEKARGKGVGKKLFEEVFIWAEDAGIHRLELTVIEDNHAAIGLYKKMGFEVEGTKKHSLWIDGTYVDELYMVKLV